MGFVPVSELLEGEDASIEWNLQPGRMLDTERIVVHRGRIAAIARVAGFGRLEIDEYDDLQSAFDTSSVNISSIDSSGAVVGSAATSRSKVSRIRTGMEYSQSAQLPAEYQWPAVRIGVNKPELVSRAADRVQTGTPREAAWAQEADRALRDGLGLAALRKFGQDMQPWGEVAVQAGYSYLAGAAVGSPEFRLPMLCAYGFMTAARAALVVQRAGWSQLLDKRASFWPAAAQIDRALAAATMAQSVRLVKYHK